MRHGAQAKVREVERFRDSPLFDERERLALEVAERMTITGQRVDDALFERLRERFSEAEAVELAATVALENFRSRLNVALGVEAQGFCPLPEARG
jgi:alkylhydroperoxidase family enzyme